MRKLQCKPLTSALKEMSVGETCIAPDGYSFNATVVTCSRLKEEGLLFRTYIVDGVQHITRIQ